MRKPTCCKIRKQNADQLRGTFVFAYAKSRFSHDVAQKVGLYLFQGLLVSFSNLVCKDLIKILTCLELMSYQCG